MASDLQAAHQLRLQQLLASGRLTPASSPTPDAHPPAAAAPAAPAKGNKRNNKKRKVDLEAVAESNPSFLPESMQYLVSVSSRSPDVGLENDHNLHVLCSFPTRQSAHDWILKNRLALARHYLRDPRISPSELEENSVADGCPDEYYLGEHCSLELLAVPHYASVDSAPDCSVSNLLFDDHFATHAAEEEAEKAKESQEAEERGAKDKTDGDEEMKAEEGEKANKAEATSASPKRTPSKRRKV